MTTTNYTELGNQLIEDLRRQHAALLGVGHDDNDPCPICLRDFGVNQHDGYHDPLPQEADHGARRGQAIRVGNFSVRWIPALMCWQASDGATTRFGDSPQEAAAEAQAVVNYYEGT